jgi:hypothetical protein
MSYPLEHMRIAWKDKRLAVWLVVYAIATTFFYRFTLDDAGITLRYAYNLAHEGNLSFNADGRVYGTTTIFWALLTTPVMWLERWVDPLVVCKLLSFAFGGVGVVLVHRLVRSLQLAPYTFVMSIAVLSVPYVVFAYSAMEFALSIVLLCVFLTAFLAEVSARTLRVMAWMGVLLFFTRPDFVLLTVPLFLTAAILNRRTVLAQAKVLLLPAAVALGGLVLLRLYYGSIVSLSFDAKILSEARDPGFVHGLQRIGEWMLKQGAVVVPLIALAWAIPRSTRPRRGLLAAAALAGSSVVFLGYFMSEGGFIVMDDAGRYYYPGILVLSLASGFVIDGAITATQSKALAIGTKAVLFSTPLLLAGGLYYAKVSDMNLGTQPRYQHSTDHYADMMDDAYIPMGMYIAENYPPSTTMIIRDAGLIPFYSRLDNVLDFWSLNEPRIVACKRACTRDVIREFDPDLIAQGGNHIDDLEKRYRPVRSFRAKTRTLVLWEKIGHSDP